MFCLDIFCDLWAKYVEWWDAFLLFSSTLPYHPCLYLASVSAHSTFMTARIPDERRVVMFKKGCSLSFWVDGPCGLAHTLLYERTVPVTWVSQNGKVHFLERTFFNVVLKKKCRALYQWAPWQKKASAVIFFRWFFRANWPLTITQPYQSTQSVCHC